MNTPIQVPEIGLRITLSCWRGREESPQPNTFISFISRRKNLKALFPRLSHKDISAELAHSLALECLDRFWSASRSCTAIVSNISMDEKQDAVYLVRPVFEGAATAGYCTDKGIPAFRCKLQDGFFIAISCEHGFYSDQDSPGEVVLTGPVYMQVPAEPGAPFIQTRRPRSFPPEVLQRISALKSRRLLISRRVGQWRSFLEWQMALVYKKQFAIRYHSAELDRRACCIHLCASASIADWKKFKNRGSLEAIAMPLNASQQPDRWVSVNGASGISLGELSGKQIRIDGGLPKQSSAQDTDQVITRTIEIRPEPEIWKRHANEIPQEGFLVQTVKMDIAPIKRQLSALDKLVNGQCRDPRLADYLFEADI